MRTSSPCSGRGWGGLCLCGACGAGAFAHWALVGAARVGSSSALVVVVVVVVEVVVAAAVGIVVVVVVVDV